MASLNVVHLIGRVTRDPELKQIAGGKCVAHVGLALNHVYTNKQGEKTDDTTFVDVEVWERLAEVAAEYAKKGKLVYFEGRLRVSEWNDTEGNKKQRLKVVADRMKLLSAKDQMPGRSQEVPASQPPARRYPLDEGEPGDDDIPF